MGKFEKGNTYGKGRNQGSKNKNTLAKKQELENLFYKNGGFKSLFECIEKIQEPKDKAAILLKIMEFFMSKQKALEITTDMKNDTVNVTFTHVPSLPITNEIELFNDD